MNRHSHWSDQLGQAQRSVFQAGGDMSLIRVTPSAALRAAVPAEAGVPSRGGVVRACSPACLRPACRLKPAFQAVVLL